MAADNELDIILKLTDQISGQMAQIQRTLKSAMTEMAASTAPVNAAMERLGKSLSGASLIQDAKNITAAVRDLGGATKLTEQEAARYNRTLTEAIAKLKALGQEAPQDMQALANATAASTKSAGLLGSTFSQVFAGLSAASLVSRAVGAITDLGKEALATAGSLVDLSNKTGLSTETIQRMQFVAKQSGSDMQAFADAAFKMGVNISEGTKKARDGAETLGLDWQALRAASPDQQFDLVVQALEAMEDPQKRNAAAVALFGKTAKDILPAIVDGYTRVAKEATVAGDAQVHALDAAGDAWDRWKARTTASFINAVGSMILLHDAVNTLTQDQRDFILQTDKSIKTTDDFSAALIRAADAKGKAKDIQLPSEKAAASPASFGAELAAATAGYKALTAAQLADLSAALQLGKSNDDIINSLNITEGVLSVAKKAFEDHKAALSKAAEAQKKYADAIEAYTSATGPGYLALLNEIGNETYEGIAFDLKRGISAEHLAEVYQRNVQVITQVAKAEKDETEAAKVLSEIRNKLEAGSLTLNEAMRQVNSTELISIRAHLDLAAAMKMVEQSIPQTVAGFHGMGEELTNIGLRSTEIDDLRIKLELAAQTIEGRLTASLHSIPELLKAAFIGGGDLGGAATAIGIELAQDIVEPLMKRLSLVSTNFAAAQKAVSFGTVGAAGLGAATGGTAGATIGGLASSVGGAALASAFPGAAAGVGGAIALSAATAGIGAAAIGVYLLAKHFLTVSQNEKDARVEFKKLQDLYGTLPATITAVGAAYERMGHTGAEAEAALKRALDASHESAEAERAALEPITAILAADEKQTTAVAAAVEQLTSIGQQFGGTVPDAFKDAVRQLASMKAVTDDEKAALLGLTKDVKPNFEQLTQTAAKYGVTLEGLGRSFQQANIEGRAHDISSDFDALVKAGGDAGGILAGMADEISSLVTDSLKFGTAIPDNMRPLIEELLRAGRLTDDAGNKLEDLAGLSFENTPLDDSIQSLSDAINALTKALSGVAPAVATATAAGATTADVLGGSGLLAGDQYHKGQTVEMGGGGYGYAPGPMTFTTRGNEEFAFSGEGKRFPSSTGGAVNKIYNVTITARNDDAAERWRDWMRSDGVEIAVEELEDGRHVSRVNRALDR